jgi:exodeoxyribonuclease VII small subunit
MTKKETQLANFDTLFSELEKLVKKMERTDIVLEEAVATYQRGVELVRLCQDKLGAAEQQLKIFDEGVLKPFKLSDE